MNLSLPVRYSGLVLLGILFTLYCFSKTYAGEKKPLDPPAALKKLQALFTEKDTSARLYRMAECYHVLRKTIGASKEKAAGSEKYFQATLRAGAHLCDAFSSGEKPAGVKQQDIYYIAVYNYAILAVTLLDQQMRRQEKNECPSCSGSDHDHQHHPHTHDKTRAANMKKYLDRADLVMLALQAIRRSAVLFPPGSRQRKIRLAHFPTEVMSVYWNFPQNLYLPQMHMAAMGLVTLSAREFPAHRKNAMAVIKQLLKLATDCEYTINEHLDKKARHYFRFTAYRTAVECALTLNEWEHGVQWYQAMKRNCAKGRAPYPLLPENGKIRLLDFTISRADCAKVFLMHYQYAVCLGMRSEELKKDEFKKMASAYRKESRRVLLDIKKRAEKYALKCGDKILARNITRNIILPVYEILGVEKLVGKFPGQDTGAEN